MKIDHENIAATAAESDGPARRAFLRRSGQLTLTGTALPFALNLAAMGEAAAFDSTDYKALVCVYLGGGNDHNNTVVPYDAPSYAQYASIRGPIALPRSALTPTLLTPLSVRPDGLQFALHPSMGGMAGLFSSGKAAVQFNVGPLVVPLTRAQYASRQYPAPPKLFSHNDQASTWQSLAPEGSAVGWGGRLGDLALTSNGNATFTCISAAGSSVFLSGRSAVQYQIATSGSVTVDALKSGPYGMSMVRNAMLTLFQQPRSNLMEAQYNTVTTRSIASQAQVALAVAASSSMGTTFPAGALADQLKIVARLIAGRNVLGAKRQVFLVSVGGYDTHDGLIAQHPALLGLLSQAMTAFYNATVELGVASQVTAFTASDFGRTLSHNGGGSDHGWGSHHLVVGGAVNGQAFYGTPPPLSIGNTAAPVDQWHVGQGRLLPTTSVDQYAATLARWFGVADSELDGILPNLKNFGEGAGRADYPRNMGFMAGT
jgi:uncharacterized protein (DUF1501 family)